MTSSHAMDAFTSHLGNGFFERPATLARVERFLAEASSSLPLGVPPPERAPPPAPAAPGRQMSP